MDQAQAVMTYGLCSTHIDILMQMFPDEDLTVIVADAATMIQGELHIDPVGMTCVLCILDVAKFVKKEI
jgi:hypothetical protein